MTTPISKQRVTSVCILGSARSCAFIGVHPDTGFCCIKGSSLEPEIRRRLAEGSMGAKGDNCPGPPFTAGEE